MGPGPALVPLWLESTDLRSNILPQYFRISSENYTYTRTWVWTHPIYSSSYRFHLLSNGSSSGTKKSILKRLWVLHPYLRVEGESVQWNDLEGLTQPLYKILGPSNYPNPLIHGRQINSVYSPFRWVQIQEPARARLLIGVIRWAPLGDDTPCAPNHSPRVVRTCAPGGT